MIKAIIFDLDNTLLDFVKMKQFAVKAAITAMIEAGLDVDEKIIKNCKYYLLLPFYRMQLKTYIRISQSVHSLINSIDLGQ